MSDEDVADVSARIDIPALRAYRIAVGRSTRQIVQALGPSDLEQRIDAARIEELLSAGALAAGARGLAEAWSGWTMVRFLLMPATRHSFTHLNEARRVSNRLKLKRR